MNTEKIRLVKYLGKAFYRGAKGFEKASQVSSDDTTTTKIEKLAAAARHIAAGVEAMAKSRS